jgi:hypothetical protein
MLVVLPTTVLPSAMASLAMIGMASLVEGIPGALISFSRRLSASPARLSA